MKLDDLLMKSRTDAQARTNYALTHLPNALSADRGKQQICTDFFLKGYTTDSIIGIRFQIY